MVEIAQEPPHCTVKCEWVALVIIQRPLLDTSHRNIVQVNVLPATINLECWSDGTGSRVDDLCISFSIWHFDGVERALSDALGC